MTEMNMKDDIERVEHVSPENANDVDKLVSWDAESEKKLRWKCDRHVLPSMSVRRIDFHLKTNSLTSGAKHAPLLHGLSGPNEHW